jgi:hypothetical protein
VRLIELVRDHSQPTASAETTPDRLAGMEAVFISLMALVVLLTGYVALVVLYKLFKTEH